MLQQQIKKSREQGFTIIEVLIVLAIAGLIILIVFLAVPALQRNSRNTSRREDASHLVGLVNEFIANNGGTLPSAIACPNSAANLCLTGEHWALFTAPATANIIAGTGTTGTLTTPDINEQAACDPTTNALSAGTTRQFAISFQVETTNGGTSNACVSG